MVANRPKLRVASTDIDQLMIGLEVEMYALAECVVGPGWRLAFTAGEKTAIHYTARGTGTLFVANFPPIELKPHAMVIVPSMLSVQIGVGQPTRAAIKNIDVKKLEKGQGKITRLIAGTGSPELILMCGYFRTSYGKSIDIFDTVAAPILEQFKASDRLDQSLSALLAESNSQHVGKAAMTASLLKQVILTLLRRSLVTPQLWSERFPILSDPQIARAFARMIANPGDQYTTQSLSLAAGLSRSAFMSRFTKAIGVSPLAALRQLRMRQAARLVQANTMPIEQIAKSVGYLSRSSFSRAFRAVYGVDPSEYGALTVAERISGGQ